MIICGVDPGIHGAIAFYDTITKVMRVYDMPTHEIMRGGKSKHEVSAQGVAAIMAVNKPDHVYMEKVGAMPGQGVSSVFSFGRSSGVIEGVMAGLEVSYTLISPIKWQKGVQHRGGKDGSRERAMTLFPKEAEQFKLKKHDGRADAALLCYYLMMTFSEAFEVSYDQ
jgi:crossover junction endodeoxyribonuclease RuvC